MAQVVPPSYAYTAAAQPGSREISPSLNPNIFLPPSEIAEATAFYLPQDGLFKRTPLIIVQDAHANDQAQIQTVRLLEYLQAGSAQNMILLPEAAPSHIFPALFAVFKNNASNQKAMDRLMHKGLFSGWEKFTVDTFTHSKNSVSVQPVEDLELYAQDWQWFRRARQNRKVCADFFDALQKNLKVARAGRLAPQTAALLDLWFQKEKNAGALPAYLPLLIQSAAEAAGIDLRSYEHQLEYPMLVRFAKLEGLETPTAKEKLRVKTEAKKLQKKINAWGLIEFLSITGPDTISPPKTSALRETLEQFYKKTEGHGFHFADYPALSRAWARQIFHEELESSILLKEIKKIEIKIFSRLFQSKKARRVFQMHQDALSLEKLLALELTREDWAYARRHTKRFEAMLQAPAGRQQSAVSAAKLRGSFKAALNFYRLAIARESALFKNTAAVMQQHPDSRIVLIAGGFHTPGLESRLRSAGLPYAVLRPAGLAGMDEPGSVENSRQIYEQALLEDHTRSSQIAVFPYIAGLSEAEKIGGAASRRFRAQEIAAAYRAEAQTAEAQLELAQSPLAQVLRGKPEALVLQAALTRSEMRVGKPGTWLNLDSPNSLSRRPASRRSWMKSWASLFLPALEQKNEYVERINRLGVRVKGWPSYWVSRFYLRDLLAMLLALDESQRAHIKTITLVPWYRDPLFWFRGLSGDTGRTGKLSLTATATRHGFQWLAAHRIGEYLASLPENKAAAEAITGAFWKKIDPSKARFLLTWLGLETALAFAAAAGLEAFLVFSFLKLGLLVSPVIWAVFFAASLTVSYISTGGLFRSLLILKGQSIDLPDAHQPWGVFSARSLVNAREHLAELFALALLAGETMEATPKLRKAYAQIRTAFLQKDAAETLLPRAFAAHRDDSYSYHTAFVFSAAAHLTLFVLMEPDQFMLFLQATGIVLKGLALGFLSSYLISPLKNFSLLSFFSREIPAKEAPAFSAAVRASAASALSISHQTLRMLLPLVILFFLTWTSPFEKFLKECGCQLASAMSKREKEGDSGPVSIELRLDTRVDPTIIELMQQSELNENQSAPFVFNAPSEIPNTPVSENAQDKETANTQTSFRETNSPADQSGEKVTLTDRPVMPQLPSLFHDRATHEVSSENAKPQGDPMRLVRKADKNKRSSVAGSGQKELPTTAVQIDPSTGRPVNLIGKTMKIDVFANSREALNNERPEWIYNEELQFGQRQKEDGKWLNTLHARDFKELRLDLDNTDAGTIAVTFAYAAPDGIGTLYTQWMPFAVKAGGDVIRISTDQIPPVDIIKVVINMVHEGKVTRFRMNTAKSGFRSEVRAQAASAAAAAAQTTEFLKTRLEALAKRWAALDWDEASSTEERLLEKFEVHWQIIDSAWQARNPADIHTHTAAQTKAFLWAHFRAEIQRLRAGKPQLSVRIAPAPQQPHGFLKRALYFLGGPAALLALFLLIHLDRARELADRYVQTLRQTGSAQPLSIALEPPPSTVPADETASKPPEQLESTPEAPAGDIEPAAFVKQPNTASEFFRPIQEGILVTDGLFDSTQVLQSQKTLLYVASSEDEEETLAAQRLFKRAAATGETLVVVLPAESLKAQSKELLILSAENPRLHVVSGDEKIEAAYLADGTGRLFLFEKERNGLNLIETIEGLDELKRFLEKPVKIPAPASQNQASEKTHDPLSQALDRDLKTLEEKFRLNQFLDKQRWPNKDKIAIALEGLLEKHSPFKIENETMILHTQQLPSAWIPAGLSAEAVVWRLRQAFELTFPDKSVSVASYGSKTNPAKVGKALNDLRTTLQQWSRGLLSDRSSAQRFEGNEFTQEAYQAALLKTGETGIAVHSPYFFGEIPSKPISLTLPDFILKDQTGAAVLHRSVPVSLKNMHAANDLLIVVAAVLDDDLQWQLNQELEKNPQLQILHLSPADTGWGQEWTPEKVRARTVENRIRFAADGEPARFPSAAAGPEILKSFGLGDPADLLLSLDENVYPVHLVYLNRHKELTAGTLNYAGTPLASWLQNAVSGALHSTSKMAAADFPSKTRSVFIARPLSGQQEMTVSIDDSRTDERTPIRVPNFKIEKLDTPGQYWEFRDLLQSPSAAVVRNQIPEFLLWRLAGDLMKTDNGRPPIPVFHLAGAADTPEGLRPDKLRAYLSQTIPVNPGQNFPIILMPEPLLHSFVTPAILKASGQATLQDFMNAGPSTQNEDSGHVYFFDGNGEAIFYPKRPITFANDALVAWQKNVKGNVLKAGILMPDDSEPDSGGFHIQIGDQQFSRDQTAGGKFLYLFFQDKDSGLDLEQIRSVSKNTLYYHSILQSVYVYSVPKDKYPDLAAVRREIEETLADTHAYIPVVVAYREDITFMLKARFGEKDPRFMFDQGVLLKGDRVLKKLSLFFPFFSWAERLEIEKQQQEQRKNSDTQNTLRLDAALRSPKQAARSEVRTQERISSSALHVAYGAAERLFAYRTFDPEEARRFIAQWRVEDKMAAQSEKPYAKAMLARLSRFLHHQMVLSPQYHLDPEAPVHLILQWDADKPNSADLWAKRIAWVEKENGGGTAARLSISVVGTRPTVNLESRLFELLRAKAGSHPELARFLQGRKRTVALPGAFRFYNSPSPAKGLHEAQARLLPASSVQAALLLQAFPAAAGLVSIHDNDDFDADPDLADFAIFRDLLLARAAQLLKKEARAASSPEITAALLRSFLIQQGTGFYLDGNTLRWSGQKMLKDLYALYQNSRQISRSA